MSKITALLARPEWKLKERMQVADQTMRSADLVIIGEPGKHRYSEMFMGTTAERVMRFSDRPVLMVKRATHGPYSRALIAYDGSEGATRALHTALLLAPNAQFRVIHAWWPPHVSFEGEAASRTKIRQENERLTALVQRATNGSREKH